MRRDMSLPRVVYEYEDVFPNELSGLPPLMISAKKVLF